VRGKAYYYEDQWQREEQMSWLKLLVIGLSISAFTSSGALAAQATAEENGENLSGPILAASAPVCKLVQRQFDHQYQSGQYIDLSSYIKDPFTDENGTVTISVENNAVPAKPGEKLVISNPFRAEGVQWVEWTLSEGFDQVWDVGYDMTLTATAKIKSDPDNILVLTIRGSGYRGNYYHIFNIPIKQWKKFVKEKPESRKFNQLNYRLYPDSSLNRFANVFSYRGELYFINEDEDENTRVTTYQLSDENTSIIGCKVKSTNKILSDGRWMNDGNLLTSFCFERIWLSMDNYQYIFEEYGQNKFDEGDFYASPGRYIGGPIPTEFLKSPWEDTSPESISLSKNIDKCVKGSDLSKRTGTSITEDQGMVITNFPQDDDVYYTRYPIKYRLLTKIPLNFCQKLAPYFVENCEDIGLIEITEQTGGSMGVNYDRGIYGIVRDPIKNETYVIPLVNLSMSLSDSLDFVDRLKD
jgi:hypothetical protein